MRIVAGKNRGLRLAEVGTGDAVAHLHPTRDRVRESLFNVLTSGRFGDPIADNRVLDLFAGTGALGFEALSRGAVHVTFVDDGAKARALIRENTGKMQAGGTSKLFRRNATRLGDCPGAPCQLVFLDPPYGKGLGQLALASATTGTWLAPDALIVWEENAPQTAPPGFTPLDARKYGDTHIILLRWTPA